MLTKNEIDHLKNNYKNVIHYNKQGFDGATPLTDETIIGYLAATFAVDPNLPSHRMLWETVRDIKESFNELKN